MEVIQNEVCKHPTHFMGAVPLIVNAREKYGIASENWTYPTEYRCGRWNDPFYAELWTDGMDWNINYWCIFKPADLSRCRAVPFIFFEDHSYREIFRDYDFEHLADAMLSNLRRREWLTDLPEDNFFADQLWPYIQISKETEEPPTNGMVKLYIEHASQPRTFFWANVRYIP